MRDAAISGPCFRMPGCLDSGHSHSYPRITGASRVCASSPVVVGTESGIPSCGPLAPGCTAWRAILGTLEGTLEPCFFYRSFVRTNQVY